MLAWEEIRVAGVLTVICCLLDVFVIWAYKTQMRLIFHRVEDTPDPFVYFVMVGGVPIVIAFLLTMNPNYKGDLRGGFPARIMALPVPTYLPVVVSLIMRSAFILLASAFLIVATRAFYSGGYGITMALGVVAIYLFVQAFDWVRSIFSGITGVVVGIGGTLAGLGLYNLGLRGIEILVGGIEERLAQHAFQAGIGVAVLFSVVYLISNVAVHASRKGRRVALPRIHLSSGAKDSGKSGRTKAFDSPLAAHVWLNVRRSFYLLPIVTLISTFVVLVLLWYYEYRKDGIISLNDQQIFLVAPIVGLINGAIAYAVNGFILKFGSSKGMSGYTFLQPYTTEQIAVARIISGALLLIPTLFGAVFFMYVLPGSTTFFRALLEAWSLGVVSSIEVLWTFASRILIIGLPIWMLMHVSTRLLSVLAFLSFCIPVTLLVEEYVGFELFQLNEDMILGSTVLGIGALLNGCYAWSAVRAYRKGLLSRVMAGVCLATWALLFAIVFGYALRATATTNLSIASSLAMACTGGALASMGVLPFISVIFDVHRKRHSASPVQSRPIRPIQTNFRLAAKSEKILLGSVACLLLVGAAIIFPFKPAYIQKWRSLGYPATSQEINEMHGAVPDETNVALKYMEEGVVEQSIVRVVYPLYGWGDADGNPIDYRYHSVLGPVGNSTIRPGLPIPEYVRESTTRYWSNLSGTVANRLHELPDENGPSRYPIDWSKGTATDSHPHDVARSLSRHLGLDALVWAMRGDSARSTESLLAMMNIADSLEFEPTMDSRHTWRSVLGYATSTLRQVMNCVQLSSVELESIQAAFETQQKKLWDMERYKQPIMETGVNPLEGSLVVSVLLDNPGAWDTHIFSVLPIANLWFPSSSQRALLGVQYLRALGIEASTWLESERQMALASNVVYEQSAAIVGSYFDYTIGYIYSPFFQVAVDYDVAITAVAVERHRLEHGRLPDTLQELVPGYMESVPMDFYNGIHDALRYWVLDEHRFVVYSWGRNGKDDGGNSIYDVGWQKGDRAFTVSTIKANELESES